MHSFGPLYSSCSAHWPLKWVVVVFCLFVCYSHNIFCSDWKWEIKDITVKPDFLQCCVCFCFLSQWSSLNRMPPKQFRLERHLQDQLKINCSAHFHHNVGPRWLFFNRFWTGVQSYCSRVIRLKTSWWYWLLGSLPCWCWSKEIVYQQWKKQLMTSPFNALHWEHTAVDQSTLWLASIACNPALLLIHETGKALRTLCWWNK